MKLTGRQLQALAVEIRHIAAGLDTMADAADHDRGFNYPDHSLTVQLFVLVFD